MANYTMTMVLENPSLTSVYGLELNGSPFYPGNSTREVGAGSTLKAEPIGGGTVYLNGTDMGRSYTHTINSNITVTCANDYSVYIVTEESDDSGGSGGGHKALIDGNAYSISGGKAMVDGAVYDISCGKAMIGGEVYEIAFGPGSFTVNITGTGNATYCYVTINGTKYNRANTLECEGGTELTAYVSSALSSAKLKSFIYFNGEQVAGGSYSGGTYTFAPEAAVVNIALSYSNNVATITITTE